MNPVGIAAGLIWSLAIWFAVIALVWWLVP